MFEILKDIGFTKGEIKVYESLFKLGQSTIGPISKTANVTPSKTYPILNKLLEKGLISKIKKNKVLYFSANNPERLITFLDEKKHKIDEKKYIVEQKIAELQSFKEKTTTDARIMQGKEGLKAFYEEHNRLLLKTDKTFRVFSFGQDWEIPEVKRFIQKQDLIRREKGIEVRVIANEKIKESIEKSNYELIKIKFTDQNIPVGTVISKKQIALMTWNKEPTIIVIDSEDIGKAYLEFFEQIWASLY